MSGQRTKDEYAYQANPILLCEHLLPCNRLLCADDVQQGPCSMLKLICYMCGVVRQHGLLMPGGLCLVEVWAAAVPLQCYYERT